MAFFYLTTITHSHSNIFFFLRKSKTHKSHSLSLKPRTKSFLSPMSLLPTKPGVYPLIYPRYISKAIAKTTSIWAIATRRYAIHRRGRASPVLSQYNSCPDHVSLTLTAMESGFRHDVLFTDHFCLL